MSLVIHGPARDPQPENRLRSPTVTRVNRTGTGTREKKGVGNSRVPRHPRKHDGTTETGDGWVGNERKRMGSLLLPERKMVTRGMMGQRLGQTREDKFRAPTRLHVKKK